FEDWAKLILGQPNRAEVLRMIEFYQSNLITAEVFYGILAAMFETNNENQQLLAVEAAGSMASPSSFVFLMSALKSIRSGTPIANAVTMRLNNYQSVGNVSHLRPVLDNHLED